jgi:hypothetical protein
MFGSNNLKNEPDDLILNSYTKSQLKLDKHVKTFARTSKITNAVNPHYYNIINRNKMFGMNGKIITDLPCFNELSIPYYSAPAYIAHYVNQSEETYVKRKGLLPADDTGKFRRITHDCIDNLHKQYNDVDNLEPKCKYSENVKKFLEQFK